MTGSPPRLRAARRRVGAGTTVSGVSSTPQVSSRRSPALSAAPSGRIRSVRPCSLTATIALRRAPAYRPREKTGTPGCTRGAMRCGSSGRTCRTRAQASHQRVDGAPQPPHSSGRTRSSTSPVSRRAVTSNPSRALDTGPTLALSGVVTVVHDGDFLGVIAEREEVALRATDRLRADATWDQEPSLPDEDDLSAFLTEVPADTTVLADSRSTSAIAVTRIAGHRLLRRRTGRRRRPTIDRSSPTGRSHRHARSRWHKTASCRSGRTARACTTCAGRSRASWECARSIWSSATSRAPGATTTTAFLATSHRDRVAIHSNAEPPLERGGGTRRNAVPGYDFPSYVVINHLITAIPLRTSALRSSGRTSTSSPRSRSWTSSPRTPVSTPSSSGSRTCPTRAAVPCWKPLHTGRIGRGGRDRTRSATASAMHATRTRVPTAPSWRKWRPSRDPGDQLDAQGARPVRRYNVTSDNWETYPILRFSEVPAVDVELVAGNGNPPLGVGECAQGPTTAAIANAVCDALGVRVRSLPLTPEQIVAAMQD